MESLKTLFLILTISVFAGFNAMAQSPGGDPPSPYNVTGSGAYNSGGVGLPVGLDGSEAGVTYTLYKDAVAQTPTKAGTGAAITFGNQLAGTYTVVGSSQLGTTDMFGSAVITVKLAQTITFGSLTDKTYGNASFALTATASSGLSVSYASSNTAVATIVGNTVTIVGAGSTNITASQIGNASYDIAPDVVQTLNVNAASLTITGVTATNKPYDGNNTAVLSGGALNGVLNSDNVTVVAGTGTFADANAGDGKSITAIGYSLGGSKAGNYTLSAQPTIAAANITAAPLTITGISISNKPYDGNATATITGTAAYSGLQNSESFAVTGTASSSFADAVVGTGKSVTVIGYTAPSANYSITQPTGLTADITGVTLTITGVTAANKVYDGTNAAILSGGALNGVLNSDDVTIVAGTGTFADANVGDGKAVTATGYSLGGSKAGNYTLSAQPTIAAANITAAPLTITGISISNKPYDGNATATITGTAAYSGLQNSESFTVTGTASASFADAVVGTGKSVTVIGYTAPNANYSITQPTGLIADITKASQTITFGSVTAKVFGNAPFDLTATASSGLPVSYASSNTAVATIVGNTVTIVGMGTTTITASQSGDATYAAATDATQNFAVNSPTQQAQTITFGTITDKTYGDASFNLTATASSGLPVSYVSSNTAVATVSGNIVTIVGAGATTITASQAGNLFYGVATNVDQLLTVNAVSLTITGVTAANKSYDGNNTAVLSGGALNGVLNSDDVTIVAGTGTFADANAGNGKAVTSTGYSLGGAKAGNYTLSAQPTVSNANITAVSLNITGVIAANKSYDGNNTAVLSGGALNGVLNSDDVTIVAGTGTFADANVGTGKSVTVTGYSLGGSKAGNYTLSAQPTVANADITAVSLTIAGVTAANKPYDGNNTAILSGGALNGVVNSDDVTIVAGTGTFADANVGDGKAVTATGYSLGGSKAGNYTLSAQPTVAAANITAAPLTITGISISNKPYDGNTTAIITGTAAYSGLQNSESFTVTGTPSASFADAVVGTGKAVAVIGYTAPSANYSITQPTGLTADITSVSSTITATGATTYTYTGLAQGPATSTVTGSTGAVTYSYSGTGGTTYAATATAPSAAGTYQVIASVAADANYNAASSVAYAFSIDKAPLTITGISISSKPYDGSVSATIAGTAAYSGLQNSESFTVTGTPSASFADAVVGTGKAVTVIGYTAPSANYSITQPTGLTADITSVGSTITATGVTTYTYSGLAQGPATSTVTGSTGAVTYSYSGTGGTTYAASATAPSAAGTYEVIATVAADANFDAVSSAAYAFSINKAPLTITGISISNKPYDGNSTATIAGTAAYSGLQNSESFAVTGTASASFADAVVGTGKSVTVIGYTAPSANYSITQPIGLTANITAVALTITAEDKTKVYDGTVYSPFTVTYNGFITGEDQTNLTGTLSFGGSAATAITAGNAYVISPYGLSSANYAITYVDGKLDITKKAQTITFNGLAAKDYGDPDFNLAGTSNSGLDVTYTSSNPLVATVSGNTVTIVGAGTTDITASQSGDANYSAATDVPQTLTINKAIQVLTLDPLPVGSIALKDFVGPIPVTASSSAGLPVVISLGAGSAATLNASNELINVGQTGNVIVNVDQAGTANYEAASISYTFDVTKSNQAITFGALASQVYSTGLTIDLTGKATTTSPLAISYSVANGPATIAGNVLTITGAGTIVVEASQAGDAAWNPATTESQSLIITKAVPVISNFGDLTKNFSDADFTLNATSVSTGLFTYSSSNPLVATVSGNTVHIVGTGTTVLTADQDFDANYGTATINANLSVVSVNQSISFGALTTKTYGDADFDLTAVASSGLAVSYVSSNTAVATVSGSTVTIVGAGTTNITASQAGNSNYDAAIDVVQSLTVDAKLLTITGVTAANKQCDGTTAATLSGGTLNGVVNSDDVTIVAGTGTFVDANVGAGKVVTATGYTLGGTKAANYTLSAQPSGMTADITKASQTISFDILTAKTFGDAAFDLTATASSGLPVSYASSNTAVATISGNTVTIVGIGTTVITASQSGDANYAAATDVTQDFAVNSPTQQAQTITFGALADKVYGDAAFSLNGTASSNLLVSYISSNTAVATVSGNTVTIVGAGATTITAKQVGNLFYGVATEVAQLLTITPSTLTITGVTATNKSYDGTTAATLSGGVLNGVLNSDDVTIVAGAGTFVDPNVGTGKVVTATGYTLGGTKAANYTLSAQPAGISADITAVALTITAEDKSKVYDGTVYSPFTVTYNGFITGEDQTNLTGTLSFVGSAATAITAGNAYVISPYGLSSTNYAITYVDGKLDITKKAQTITFNGLTAKDYGDPDFNLAGTSNSGLDVTYVSSNPLVATVSGNTVTIVGAGTTDITASQSGDANYSAATDVPQTLTINKAIQVLTLDPLPVGSIALKDFVGAIPVTASSSAGLPVVISLGAGSAATLDASNNLINVGQTGNVIVNVDQAGNANYEAASISYTFDVTKSNQAITFGAMANQVYSVGLTVDLTGKATTTSPLAISYSVANGPATIAGNVLTITGAGTIVVEASQAGDAAWNPATTESQSLIITKAVPVISNFGDLTKNFSDADFTLNATSISTGLFTYSSSNPLVATVSGNTVHIVGTGTTVLTADQDFDDNYGTATINANLSVASVNQSISFGTLVNNTYGDADFDLTAVASSGLAVSYVSSNTAVATVSGNTVHIVGVGTTNITASQTGNANYDAALDVVQALTVDPAILTITGVTAANKPYDGNNTAILSGGTLNGVVNSDDVTIVAGTGTFVDANVGAGKVVTATGYSLGGTKAANYTLSAQPAGISSDITAVSLTITAEDKTKVYDGTVYSPFTVTYSGFITGEDQTNLTGTLSFGGSAATAITAGNAYVISPYGLSSTNYAITYVDGKLDITKKAQTITFNGLTAKNYGDPDFNLAGTSNSGLDVTYVSSNPLVATISGNTVTIVGAGSTTITASQSGDANYSAAADVQQTLNVNKAIQVLILDPLPVGSIPLKDFVGAIPVTASSSAGLPVVISLGAGSAATLNASNELINVGQTGNVIVNVDQAGDANYEAASISYTFDVTKSNQAITFGALASQVYATGLTVDLTGKATTTSPLAISYSVANGPATIAGNVLTITGAGTIVVEASQAGDAAWNPATTESQSLVITKAAPVISNFGDLTKNFSDADFTLNATSVSTGLFTYSSSNPLVATVSGNTVHIVGTGTTVLTADQNFDDNYGTATINANLSVVSVNQSISFGTLTTKTYGDADFDLTAVASSGLAVSYVSSNSAVATVSGSTVTIVGAGTTNITATQAGDANFDAALGVVQALTVDAKSITITGVSAANKPYDGTTATTLSGGTLNGVVNSDDVTIVAGTGTFADAAVGTAKPVTVTGYSLGGTKAANYTLSAQPNGIVADITKVDQIISFASLTTKTIDDVPFTVSATGGASGNPVTFTSSDSNIATCTGLNGSTITIISSGSCTIYADQAGDGNYNAAVQVGQLLTITGPASAITFTAPTNGTLTVMNGATTLTSGDLITNGTVLTVTTTPDLGYVQDVLTANGTPIVGNSITVSGATTIAATFTIPTWSGSTDTDWNTATNWTPNVVPTNLIDVIVPAVSNMPLVADNSVCHNLTINSGAVVTIPAAMSLTVAGSITNNAGVTGLVIKSSASLANGTLIFNNAQNAPVPSTVEMYSKASWNLANAAQYRYKWQYFGIPVRTLATAPTFNGSYVRRYDETQLTYNWIAETAASTLLPFNGYEITQEAATTYSMTGDLVNADFSQTLVKTAGALNEGTHVFANPYTAAIDITKLNFGSQTESTVYLYNTGTVADWATYVGLTDGANPGQYTAAPVSTAGTGTIPGQIPSMQGFVVKAMSNDVNATFGIPYSSVVTKNVDKQRAPSVDRSNSSKFVYTIIDVVGATGGDRMWLFTEPNCTHSFDNSWDGRKMLGSPLVPQLFAKEADGDYQVNSVNDVNNTDLGFQTGTDSKYTLRFTHTNTQSVYDKLYLYDYETGSVTDITASGTEYSFVTTQTTSKPATRFKILSTLGGASSAPTVTDNSTIKVFSSNKTIFVRNMSKEHGDLMVYDVAGRFIDKLPFSEMSITAMPTKLIPGVYVVIAVINNQKVVTNNVIIP